VREEAGGKERKRKGIDDHSTDQSIVGERLVKTSVWFDQTLCSAARSVSFKSFRRVWIGQNRRRRIRRNVAASHTVGEDGEKEEEIGEGEGIQIGGNDDDRQPTTKPTTTTTYLARGRRPRRLVNHLHRPRRTRDILDLSYRLFREPFAPPYCATRIHPSRRPRRCRLRNRIVHPTSDRRNHADRGSSSVHSAYLIAQTSLQHRTTPLSLGSTLIPLVPWSPGLLVIRTDQTRPAYDNGTADNSTLRRYDDATAPWRTDAVGSDYAIEASWRSKGDPGVTKGQAT
jgi:hypothetical protein